MGPRHVVSIAALRRAAFAARYQSLAIVACALLAWGRAARAEEPAPAAAKVEGGVMLVLGRTEGQAADPALAALEALHRPPFDSFPSKALLRSVNVSLIAGKEAEVPLPNGRTLRLLWLDRTAEGRFRVRVSIDRPGKRDYLPWMTVVAAPGDPFFVAGQKYQGGTLILGITLGVPPAANAPRAR